MISWFIGLSNETLNCRNLLESYKVEEIAMQGRDVDR